MDKLDCLAQQLGEVLQQQGLMLTLAESCTGGMVAQAVTSVAGSSTWFERGFVTYSNQAKVEMLGVSEDTLQQYGAVSEQTATEMAIGALKHSHAAISASITGIAGPTGGSEAKPVGTVCFACAINDKCTLNTTQYFQGNRQAIREQAAQFVLKALLDLLRA
jgi:nicotinamide-nucleotide amidase